MSGTSGGGCWIRPRSFIDGSAGGLANRPRWLGKPVAERFADSRRSNLGGSLVGRRRPPHGGSLGWQFHL